MSHARSPFACLVLVFVSLLACSDSDGPTALSRTAPRPIPNFSCEQTRCLDLSGSWNAGWHVNGCGAGPTITPATATQTGCKAEITVEGLGTFYGCVEPVRVPSEFEVRFADGSPGSDDSSCNNAGTASVAIEDNGGVFFPFEAEGRNCCRQGSVLLSR